MIRFRFSLLVGLLFVAVTAARAEDTRLLRFPAIHGDRIVFSYAGDLYSVSASGGVARRLDERPGIRDVRAVFAERQGDRVHGAV